MNYECFVIVIIVVFRFLILIDKNKEFCTDGRMDVAHKKSERRVNT